MKRTFRIALVVLALIVVLLIGLFVVVLGIDRGPEYVRRDVDTAPHTFEARALYAASDLDMIGTSYADGVLQPIAGAFDVLSRVDVNRQLVQSSTARVSSSVTGWPGNLELSPDAKYAYVIETAGAAPANTERVKSVYTDLNIGTHLTTLELPDNEAPRVVHVDEVGTSPMSVHPSPNGQWLAIALRDDAMPLAFVILKDGVPTEIRHPKVSLPIVAKPNVDPSMLDIYAGVSFARVSPDGRFIAVHIRSTDVAFGEIIFDDANLPIDVRFGPSLVAGKYISIGRWSLDGRYYIVSDTGWGPSPLDPFLAGPGQLVSIDVDNLNGKIVSTATVSCGPEGIEINRSGDMFVAVNMEHTYIPENFVTKLIPRRLEASLSLISFDESNGSLRTVDGPLAFKGELPEDAVFDRSGNMIAVAVFNDRVAVPQEGWIELFSIDRSSGSPQVRPTGKRIRLPRGAHDLAIVY